MNGKEKRKLEEISNKLLDVLSVIETVKDGCIGSDNLAYSHVLDIACNQQLDIYFEIENMY